MIKKILGILTIFAFSACAMKTQHEVVAGVQSKATQSEGKEAVHSDPSQKTTFLVEQKDLELLEKLASAMEEFIMRADDRNFTAICKDKRFDCFVNDKLFPPGRKKMTRKFAPYSSGSKMGAHEDGRIHLRFDFYPQKLSKKKKKH